MHKAIQTRLNNRIPIGDRHQVLIEHGHGRHVAAKFGVVCLRQRAARVDQDGDP